MTTAVTVRAFHGVPVEVTGVDPASGAILMTQRVEPDREITVHAHSGQEIRVRELGPQDIPETPSPAQPE